MWLAVCTRLSLRTRNIPQFKDIRHQDGESDNGELRRDPCHNEVRNAGKSIELKATAATKVDKIS